MPMSPRLLRPILSGDPDALRYIAAVQQADQQSLEPAVRKAITDFVVGCKRDGIWNAIKASCILMGARTLSGALTPLKGGAPTNVNNNFVSGDYNRKTGLVGNGSTKFLDTNRLSDADPQDNVHAAAWVSTAQANTAGALYLGAGGFNISGSLNVGASATNLNTFYRSRNGTLDEVSATAGSVGLVGLSRDNSSTYNYISGSASGSISRASQSPVSLNTYVFTRNVSNAAQLSTDGRIAFYSIGESLTLSSLSSRVSALVAAIGAALP